MADVKKYFWLKLKNSFFDQKEIKKLRKIAGGDTFTIIYLKMQLLSISNGGVIRYEGTEEDLTEQLSFEIDEDIDNIRLTLAFLQSNKLIEQLSDNDFMLNKVPELIGSETNAAERMRKMREKRNKVTPLLQDVSKSYTEIEKEKEIELDKDIDKEIKKEKDIFVLYSNGDKDLLTALRDFEKMRKSIKKPISDRAKKMLLSELDKLATDNKNKIEILDQSILHNWQTVYPLKIDKQKPKPFVYDYGNMEGSL